MITLPGWRGGGTPILSYIQTNLGGSKFCISISFLFFLKIVLFYLFSFFGRYEEYFGAHYITLKRIYTYIGFEHNWTIFGVISVIFAMSCLICS